MTAVPSTRIFVAGEVVLASYFNTNINGPVNFLLAPPILEIRQITTGQVIATATWTSITYNTEDVDSSGMHSTSTNTSRATAVYPGWYQQDGAAPFPSNATGVRGVRHAVNGTVANGSSTLFVAFAGGSGPNVPSRTKHLFLNVNDYSEVQCFQNSGGNLTLAITADEAANMSLRWVSN